MSPMIPDCGVLATPRRSPPLKLNAKVEKSSPKVALLPYIPPPQSEAPGVTLSTGLSFSFYKSPKLPVTPVRKVESEPVIRRTSKHRKDGINKGVGHKIKKPKPKSKEQKRKKHNAKMVFKRLKEGNFTPCPWIPANRSPVKASSRSGQKKKRHTLSSPGMSLLEDDVSQDEAEETPGKKFFTSRSRASATVNIGKNVQLAAKKGDLILTQREGPFLKKNVGRVVEEELEQFITLSHTSESLPVPSSLPSVKANPRPMPTRVPMTPSPPKRQQSPRKTKKLFNPSQMIMSDNNSELQDLESALSELGSGEKRTGVEGDGFLRRSPRKSGVMLTPVKKSTARRDVSSPSRRSPRKSASPAKTSSWKSVDSHTPVKNDRLSSPVRSSPRKCASPARTPSRATPVRALVESQKRTPVKRSAAGHDISELESWASPKKSPMKAKPRETSINRSIQGNSQREMAEDETLVTINGATPSGGSTTSPKLFPVFDREHWRSNSSVDSKNGKTCHKHHRNVVRKSSDSQMVIDAGQKEFGVRQCADCGVVYEIANQEDEASHDIHHNSIHNSLKFMGWKKENLVRNLDEFGGRVLMITTKDPSYCWRKVEEVLKVVDNELGFSESGIQVKENTHAFLYISDRKVLGCLIGEKINKANRVIPSKEESTTTRLLCCSQEQFDVWAGVSRLWVLEGHRRKGIASKLVDALRCNVLPGHILGKNDIAFSDPTESGARFAEKYSRRRDFFVYRR